ncbi:MAG: hypothetical protein B6D59_04425 [Campylobacteraceae bacterium 4484_4]|nr:MAG: hypothetical protein B6D59_04425 [Campylobacteraceae bacterium 4484_4]
MTSLSKFLAGKPLYYREIDYSRMPRVWKRISAQFTLPKIIHIIGTNGKGSTGRFLAHYLWRSGRRTGHYTSPHILRFNERIWIDGKDIEDQKLESAHQKLGQILTSKEAAALSYFEYTTLLAVVAFEGLEYVVMEAGLGGEYDATAVFPKELTLVTSIGFDHQAFLGETIEAIARTKLMAVQKFAILGRQPSNRVYKMAKKVSREKGVEFFRVEHFYTREESIEAEATVAKMGLPDVFANNLLLAMAGAKFFGFEIDFSKIEDLRLFGRVQKIAPHITIDVGHNPMAARALRAFYLAQKKQVTLLYNSYEDKDYKNILTILKPIVQKVEILPIYGERVVSEEELIHAIEAVGLLWERFEKIDENRDYLIFGSFAVVERFLEIYGQQQERDSEKK